ncbi:MAG: MarR family winged helix-turn-helix transcriptional regulator [Sarcina sp.]
MGYYDMRREDGIKYIIYFRKAKKLYKSYVEKELKEFRLSQIEIEIIAYLNRYSKNNTAKEIVEYLSLSKGMISRTLDSLIAKEIIELQKDKVDKRVLRLKLTDKSEELVRKLEVSNKKFFEGLISNIGEEKLDIFTEVLEDMIENLKDLEKGI